MPYLPCVQWPNVLLLNRAGGASARLQPRKTCSAMIATRMKNIDEESNDIGLLEFRPSPDFQAVASAATF
jgi:hypothetical protein